MKKLALILTICTIAATSSKADPIKLVGGKLNEVLRPAAKISGTTLVGVMFVDYVLQDQLSLTAALPGIWAGQETCVTMISADGLYEAANTYSISPDWKGGKVVVDHPTSYPEKLVALSSEEIAVLGRPGSCQEVAKNEVVPIGWRQPDDSRHRRLRVYLNAFHADEAYLFVGSDPTEPAVTCRHPKTDVATTFDYVCDIDLDGTETSVDLELNRVRGGQISEPTFFTILLSAP